MTYNPANPLIVQSDSSILVEVDSPRYGEVRSVLSRFAELVKSPEHVHTYRITPLSLWNASASGMTDADVVDALCHFGKYGLPQNVAAEIREYMRRFGKLVLGRELSGERRLILQATDSLLLDDLSRQRRVAHHLGARLSPHQVVVAEYARGLVKQALARMGWPVDDRAGYTEGEPLAMGLLQVTRGGQPFRPRDYQREAAEIFHASGSDRGGSGVIVLPCGAGKTVVGMDVMARVQRHTLILTTSVVAVRQWRSELLDKTSLAPDQIGEYSGETKEIRPVTAATYQVVTYRKAKSGAFPHFGLLTEHGWGLIIYDEVHLLPAPMFRITAEIQARRRLGLTATLIREDGLEQDVFSLIGPKKYDVPWLELERSGWIAPAQCREIRLPLPDPLRHRYAMSEPREKFRVAADNPEKDHVVLALLERHKAEQVLVIGQYLSQLKRIALAARADLITGQTPNSERERLFQAFRQGKVRVLVVSKVANFAIDLPEASVAIQVSGSFGSRQEEAQRLGRILRPKGPDKQAMFYSIVSKETQDQSFSAKRQLFLTEQGYTYTIEDSAMVVSAAPGDEATRPHFYVIDGGRE